LAEAKIRGAQALIEALACAGVKRVFTLSGNHIMPIFDAALDAGMELIHVRHEAAAVHMADAYARLTGQTGVALVTGGPGHANAVSALFTARLAESPVLLLSGHAPSSEKNRGAFQEMAQSDMAATVTKESQTNRGAQKIGSDVAAAIRHANSGRRGPVHLSLPVDHLEGEVNAGLVRPEDFKPDEEILMSSHASNLLDPLSKAKRPLILAGPAFLMGAGRKTLAALEAASGVVAIGMESPRGIADPSLGSFARVLEQADCILLLGKRLDFTLKFGKPPFVHPECEFVQVDAEPEEFHRTQRSAGARLLATWRADPLAAAKVLASRAKRREEDAWANQVREAIAYRPPEWASASSGARGCLHPVQALRPLQALLAAHPDAVFISDGGEFGQWAQACLSAPHRLINGVAGAIGIALPFALAARIAMPDAPVIACMGDGTFGFHPAEIDTAVRYKLPFVAVVGNDARWNAEYQIQLREFGPGREIATQLLPTRYDQVAQAFGGHGEHVTQPGELLPAARRALESGLPAVLNVTIEGVAAPHIPE
jgi:acetolactate synthase-1/2/3 large subunit